MSSVYIVTDVTPFHGLLKCLKFLSYFPHEMKISPFYVLLTVHPGMSLVNTQLDAQFFLYVYFYSTVWYAGAYAPAYQTVVCTE